jgi:hypothetical protein
MNRSLSAIIPVLGIAALAGCSGTMNVGTEDAGGTTNGGTNGQTSTGGTTGTITGALAAGAPCTANEQCQSFSCGVLGSGNCCATQCMAAIDFACNPTGCDAASGACTYSAGNACGAPTCSDGMLTIGACDDSGTCSPGSPATCPFGFACNVTGTACLTSCSTSSDCAAGFVCNHDFCVPPQLTGSCTADDNCTSGICGISGHGHCCTQPGRCSTSDSVCGASDCDGDGACLYPSIATPCPVPQACINGSAEGPFGVCDGLGVCTVTATPCAPYTCGAMACSTSCADSSGCFDDALCDNSVCCSGLAPGRTLLVDGVFGDDAAACCGLGDATPCQTLTRAMALITSGLARQMTIIATVDGGGGDWTPSGEIYPIVLGWGAELRAPGVFFLDPAGVNHDILDVQTASDDPLGYASIVGTAENPVGIGMNQANTEQTSDSAAIGVWKGTTLYISNAIVNGPAYDPQALFRPSSGIHVYAGAGLVLGQDQSSINTGTVYIGATNTALQGNIGIYCDTDGASLGCSIADAVLAGQSSVVIRGQSLWDIFAQDFSTISLASSPVIGAQPSTAGLRFCPIQGSVGVLLWGQATMTLSQGLIQCADYGVDLMASLYGDGNPVFTVDDTTISSNGTGIYASAGKAYVANTTIKWNQIGVWQDTDGLNNAAIDLSGDGSGGNTVICSSGALAANGTPGVDVYNTSTQMLNASNVTWDTPGPDYFSCDLSFTTCLCNNATCSVAPGGEGMDAVEDSTNLGGIATTGNGFTDAGCE